MRYDKFDLRVGDKVILESGESLPVKFLLRGGDSYFGTVLTFGNCGGWVAVDRIEKVYRDGVLVNPSVGRAAEKVP